MADTISMRDLVLGLRAATGVSEAEAEAALAATIRSLTIPTPQAIEAMYRLGMTPATTRPQADTPEEA